MAMGPAYSLTVSVGGTSLHYMNLVLHHMNNTELLLKEKGEKIKQKEKISK